MEAGKHALDWWFRFSVFFSSFFSRFCTKDFQFVPCANQWILCDDFIGNGSIFRLRNWCHMYSINWKKTISICFVDRLWSVLFLGSHVYAHQRRRNHRAVNDQWFGYQFWSRYRHIPNICQPEIKVNRRNVGQQCQSMDAPIFVAGRFDVCAHGH